MIAVNSSAFSTPPQAAARLKLSLDIGHCRSCSFVFNEAHTWANYFHYTEDRDHSPLFCEWAFPADGNQMCDMIISRERWPRTPVGCTMHSASTKQSRQILERQGEIEKIALSARPKMIAGDAVLPREYPEEPLLLA